MAERNHLDADRIREHIEGWARALRAEDVDGVIVDRTGRPRRRPESHGAVLPRILLGVVAVIVLLLLVVATRPSTFHIERSLTIAAPPERAFAEVNDFSRWGAWSPWEKIDPQMKRTFDGPPSGTGAGYAWAGDSNVGEGRMTIVRSEPPRLVAIRLEFLKPFAATNMATFTFAPTGEGTRVTWAMDGRNNFVAKAVSLFIDMDDMIGGNFERGLAAMKTLAESTATADAAAAKPAAPSR